jgi:hypothetical protein
LPRFVQIVVLPVQYYSGSPAVAPVVMKKLHAKQQITHNCKDKVVNGDVKRTQNCNAVLRVILTAFAAVYFGKAAQ